MFVKTKNKNKKNSVEKSRGNTYKTTSISLDNCPRVPNMISQLCLDIVIVHYRQIGKESNFTTMNLNENVRKE